MERGGETGRSDIDERLVYEVGAHRGEDIRHYLEQGYRVVAIEADPDLAAYCAERFKDDQVTVLSGAVAPGGKKVKFYRNRKDSQLSTACRAWARRNLLLYGAASTPIEVDAIDFAQVLRDFGVPYYLHVDIEGMDMECVRALREFEDRPVYVSIEASDEFEVWELVDLGYDLFSLREQDRRRLPLWGRDIPKWYGPEKAVKKYRYMKFSHWYDLHAHRSGR